MKIAIAGFEKGTGKTTLALNLAAALARQGQHTLLVDADPQGELDGLVGLSESGVVLDMKATQILRATSVDGMHLLSGFGATMAENANRARALEKMRRLGDEFSAMVFDLGSSSDEAMVEALRMADVVILAVRDASGAAASVLDLLRCVAAARRDNPHLRFGGFLKMRCESWGASPAEDPALAAVSAEFDGAVYDLAIAEDPELARSGVELLPLVEFAPYGEAGRRISELAALLTGKEPVAVVVGEDESIGLNMAETIVASSGSSSQHIPLPGLPMAPAPPQQSLKQGFFATMLGWLGRVFGK